MQDINFWGNVYPTFVALPYLHQSNGRVIVNASVENWLPLPRMSLYAVSMNQTKLSMAFFFIIFIFRIIN
jgi:NAD(P)-dependent dehydrogenase (short-subunit alcohol dehydrogenase family)